MAQSKTVLCVDFGAWDKAIKRKGLAPLAAKVNGSKQVEDNKKLF